MDLDEYISIQTEHALYSRMALKRNIIVVYENRFVEWYDTL